MSRWDQLQQHFHAALVLPPEQRAGYLAALKTDEPALYNEVIELLRAEVTQGSNATQIIEASAAGYVQTLDDALVGATIGSYEITQVIGNGGMGTVYQARRADGSFDREVALKVVKRGMDTDSVLARFAQERQLLAQLSHPNIAALLDGGVTEDGRPFFVMELIEGEPLLSYCDRKRLSVQRRLKLFRQICDAIHYAHQNLIVHRDLKPANILVTEDGTPKLLDFGIAKPLDASQQLTQTGVMPFTPAYAAPEQLTGGAISTATDIYALGIVLYELLSGHRPFETRKEQSVLISEILSSDPARPSTAITRVLAQDPDDPAQQSVEQISEARRTEAKNLRQTLRGDLDTICLMALRREPKERYGSAAALADDILAHLQQRPVSARPRTIRYQAGKFLRRNRWAVAAACAGFTLFIGSSLYYTARVTDERDRAVLEQARTSEVVDFVIGLFAQADPAVARGEEITARELLDTGVRDINNRLAKRPAIRGKMLEVMGSVYSQLGDTERARELLEAALENQQAALDVNPMDLGDSMLMLGIVKQDLGDYERADELFKSARAIFEAEQGPTSEAVREVIGAQAYLAETNGDFDQAETLFRQSLALARNNAGDEPTEPLGMALKELGGLLRLKDQLPEAEQHIRGAIEVMEVVYGGQHPQYADAQRQLAGLLRDTNRIDDAEALYLEIIESRTAMLGEDHREVIHTWNSYLQLVELKGDIEGALAIAERIIASTRRISKGKPHVDMPALQHNRAFMLRKLGRFREAEAGYKAAIAAQEAIGMEPDHPNRLYPLAALGQVYLESDRFEEAAELLNDVLEKRRQHFPEDHRLVSEVKSDLGASLGKLGEFEKAEALLLSAHEASSATRDAMHPNVLASRFRLRELYAAMGKPERVAAFADPDES